MNAVSRIKPTVGRWMLMTDEKSITRDNIERVVGWQYAKHQKNVQDENFLFDYERGIQPILDRTKDIRPDINTKVVENNAAKVVDVHTNYCFSKPVTLVQRAKVELDAYGNVKGKDEDDSEDDDMRIAVLNKMNQEQKKSTKDIKLARDFFTCGLGYMMVYPNRDENAYSPFEIMTLNPRTTFVIYSNDAYRDPMCAVTYFPHDDGTISATAYTKDFIYELDTGLEPETFVTKSYKPNVLGVIPVVEFSMSERMGVFEKAIPVMDAINLINSDRINDIAQHVQSLLWLNNCELDEEGKEELVNGDGVIMTQSTEGKSANITYLSQTLDQGQIQTLVDYYHQQILELTSTPSWQESSGGSTTGAMQLSNGWQSLEISANAVEQVFIEAEMQLLEAEVAIIRNDKRSFGGLEDIEISDIEIKFCRSKNYDLVSKTNALVSLINVGVDGLTAFNTVNLFTDSQQAWVDSEEIIKGIQEKLVAKDEPKEDTDTEEALIGNIAFADKDEEGNGGENNEPKDKTEESLQPSKVAMVED